MLRPLVCPPSPLPSRVTLWQGCALATRYVIRLDLPRLWHSRGALSTDGERTRASLVARQDDYGAQPLPRCFPIANRVIAALAEVPEGHCSGARTEHDVDAVGAQPGKPSRPSCACAAGIALSCGGVVSGTPSPPGSLAHRWSDDASLPDPENRGCSRLRWRTDSINWER
jgi:hypothetical protein